MLFILYLIPHYMIVFEISVSVTALLIVILSLWKIGSTSGRVKWRAISFLKMQIIHLANCGEFRYSGIACS